MARFLVDINVSRRIVELLREGQHDIARAVHGEQDDEIVNSCVAQDRILVTFNREAYMRNLLRESLPKGLRVFSLPSLSKMRKKTRFRLERENSCSHAIPPDAAHALLL